MQLPSRMAKARRVFVCRSCGGSQARWLGKCPDCNAWDSLEETIVEPVGSGDAQRAMTAAWIAPDGAVAEGSGELLSAGASVARSVAELVSVNESVAELMGGGGRLVSGINELDRVLGGGLVPGSVVLIGGEPGIGKSTLMLQAAFAWASESKEDARVMYVSSEESAQQVALRAKRLSEGVAGAANAALPDSLYILAETNLARIIEQGRRLRPAVIIIDSVQMIYKSDVTAAPGSVTQLRRCAADLVYLAKASGVAVVLVGHVTKEGTLAGPRLLEHLVDCVLSFEGDRYHSYRVVRAAKNRFGTTLEIGLFEMTGRGLTQVPQGAGVPASSEPPRPGSVVCPVLTGTRCILLELQALTATGFLGAAKRKSSGVDSSRLAMLIAVLEQHAGLRLADRDVFASSVGGIKVSEPAGDLALLLAIGGAHYRRALPPATAAVGEVGLGGEVRSVPQLEQRVREAARLGYKHVLTPVLSRGERASFTRTAECIEVKNVDAALAQLG